MAHRRHDLSSPVALARLVELLLSYSLHLSSLVATQIDSGGRRSEHISSKLCALLLCTELDVRT